MNLKSRVGKLEAASFTGAFDLTVLTDDELNALIDCYDDQGQPIEGRITPELEAALLRAKR